jgi:hypothetical protein
VHSGRLFYVYVNDYASLRAAEADEGAARAIRGQGAIAQAVPCSTLRHDPAGYHHCDVLSPSW